MYMRFVHLTLHSRSRLRSRTHILANVIETNKRSLPNSRLSFFIVLVLSARLAILTEKTYRKDTGKIQKRCDKHTTKLATQKETE